MISLAFCPQPAAPAVDTPELSAFLRNSTIPHLVRKRDVPVLEPHRQSPVKILVSHLRVQGRPCHRTATELPRAGGLSFEYCRTLSFDAQVGLALLAVHSVRCAHDFSVGTGEYLQRNVFTLLNLLWRPHWRSSENGKCGGECIPKTSAHPQTLGCEPGDAVPT